MPLVEIIRGEHSSEETIVTGCGFTPAKWVKPRLLLTIVQASSLTAYCSHTLLALVVICRRRRFAAVDKVMEKQSVGQWVLLTC